MPLNFPSTPSDGQLYTVGNQTWRYNLAQTKWMAQNFTPMTVSATAPSAPKSGELWYDTNDGTLLIYAGNAWVQVAGYTLPSDTLRTADIGSTVQAYSTDILTTDDFYVRVGPAFTFGTARALTGAAHDGYHNLPAGITQIDMIGLSVSSNGAAAPLIQLGSVADDFVQTGYLGVGDQFGNAGDGNATVETDGLRVQGGAAGDVDNFIATWTLVDPDARRWAGVLRGALTNVIIPLSGFATITLTGELDRIRIVTAATFDGGTINIRYK